MAATYMHVLTEHVVFADGSRNFSPLLCQHILWM